MGLQQGSLVYMGQRGFIGALEGTVILFACLVFGSVLD